MIEIYSDEWAIKEFEITLKMLPDGVSIEKSKIIKLKKGRGRKMYIMLNNLANMLNVSAQFLFAKEIKNGGKMTKKINKNTNLPMDKNGRIIMPDDILRTPENTFGTFKIDKFCKNNEFAIESPGSYAIDYENETFFNSCEIVSNIKICPYFYEMLVSYFEE